jgi:hypothetical protein
MQNFSEGYLRDPVLSGEVALPVGDMPEPFLDAEASCIRSSLNHGCGSAAALAALSRAHRLVLR